MRFAYPALLALVLAVPLAAFFWVFLRARREKALSRITLKVPPPGAGSLQMWLVTSALAFILLAAARPQWGRDTTVTALRSRNVVVAIDVSRSMLAEDVRPNRLERVKADVSDLISSLGDDRCALVAFRRIGVALCPLTNDRAFLRSALESLTPDSVERGATDLGSGIRESLNILDPAADDHNAIILISDGADLRNGALDAALLAKKRGVKVFTVGIGDPLHGVTVVAENGQGVQNPTTVRLEEGPLRAIAETTGARYVPLATLGTAETTLGSIYKHFIRQVAMSDQNEEESRLGERYQVFLVPGLILLIAGAALSKGRLITSA